VTSQFAQTKRPCRNSASAVPAHTAKCPGRRSEVRQPPSSQSLESGVLTVIKHDPHVFMRAELTR
jgi:hypothetical protein